MKRAGFVFSFCILWFGNTAIAQSKQIFLLDDFIERVRLNYPMLKVAVLQVEKAKADLLTSRAGFDPYFQLSSENKTFDGKNYYFYTNPELKIPTWPGIDVKAGLENNGGSFLNSENTAGKTSYLGVEVPLARNLLMDKRRAMLQQSKIMVDQSEQLQLQYMNDIMLEAYISYYNWSASFNLLTVFNGFVENNRKRLQLVRNAVIQGDRPAMDTTEAFVQLQNLQMMQAQAQLNFINAGIQLSNYLWNELDTAYTLPDNFIPEEMRITEPADSLLQSQLIAASYSENPSLKMYDYKLLYLEVERKLKFQSMLPYINLKANLLNKGYNVLKGFNAMLLENNYKLGIDIKVPLRLSEGRGSFRAAKLKIKETNYEMINKRWETENKIKQYCNEAINVQKQLGLAQNMYLNYAVLLRSEETRFRNGESSLFLINSREIKLLESLQKITELRFKNIKALYTARWAAGLLR